MNNNILDKTLTILLEASKTWQAPIITLIAERSNDPFQILVSTVLSLRTKDETTTAASRRLFEKADTPESMLRLSPEEIRKLIFPVGFYRRKSEQILKICRILLEAYDGRTPDALEELLKLPGVGRKTANLVVTLGFGKPGICVDTHVHRITNRFGYLKTNHPDETEMVLRDILPKKWWIPINDILVAFGQGLCRPVSPLCSRCAVYKYCERVGVEKTR